MLVPLFSLVQFSLNYNLYWIRSHIMLLQHVSAAGKAFGIKNTFLLYCICINYFVIV